MKRLFITILLFFSFSAFTNEITYKDWRVNIVTDPITDKKTVSMKSVYVSNSDSISSAFFTVSCDSVFIVPFSIHNSLEDYEDGLIKVIFRVDKNTPVEMEWEKKSSLLITNQKEFLNKEIQGATKFIIRVGSKSTVDLKFPLAGYKKAYERLEKECSN
ncbi:hypothetical protein [Gilliamella sp. B2911]|uniref:hypothetical protein n=1 Tax=Gilliamella sp. B2911 TaxID=2817980 RepID=UPI00226A794A|nr:hypothetical protein [Gilliamella sp. B2911]MCX8663586.1 hypothetical protein [Gilliamella sp. B2911]